VGGAPRAGADLRRGPAARHGQPRRLPGARVAGRARADGYEDISRNVRRTWTICLRRLLVCLVTDRAVRRLVFSPAVRSRGFVLSLPRLAVALRTGAMRYGVFVWERP
jgi:tocopherol O-methyltransferase